MKTHQFSVRVYYEDTDAQAIVYHPNYLNYMCRARTEMLREAGYHQSQIDEYFVAGEITVRYKASAKLDDELVVETSVINIGGASIKIRQNVLKRVASGDILLLEGVVTLIYVAQSGRPVRIPDHLRDAFSPYLAQNLAPEENLNASA